MSNVIDSSKIIEYVKHGLENHKLPSLKPDLIQSLKDDHEWSRFVETEQITYYKEGDEILLFNVNIARSYIEAFKKYASAGVKLTMSQFVRLVSVFALANTKCMVGIEGVFTIRSLHKGFYVQTK